MLNRVILIGRLTKDPELRYTGNGNPVANFTLAVDRQFSTQQGEKETDFIRITAWRKLAEIVAEKLQKGRLVAIEGRLQIDNYEKDGEKKQSAGVVADNVRFLDWPKDQEKSGSEQAKTVFGGQTVQVDDIDFPF